MLNTINRMRSFCEVKIFGYLLLACNSLLAQEVFTEPSNAFDQFQASAWLQTHSTVGRIQVKSWKTQRDTQVVKQNSDYSCGAASLATLLTEYYRFPATEQAILQVMDKGDLRASFEDMVRALMQFGFKAQGFAASWEQLVKLRMPVVVYLKHRKDDHFSVLRGIDKDTVWLADPSLGNRTYSKSQFLAMWQTREADAEQSDLSGKFLAVLPDTANTQVAADFFNKHPRRQSSAAMAQLAVRQLR